MTATRQLLMVVGLLACTPPTRAGRSLAQSSTECYVSAEPASGRDKICVLASVGVSSSACVQSGEAGTQNTFYSASDEICALAIPVECSALTVSASEVDACSESVSDSILALLEQASDTLDYVFGTYAPLFPLTAPYHWFTAALLPLALLLAYLQGKACVGTSILGRS